ncbi:hypothetical protein Tco_0991935, partial [Tanacetum coccineum]
VDQLEYSRAIGCLIYAMTSTRPDIAYAVGRLSRFTSNPSRKHWHAITRVFKYLMGTMNYCLSYVGYPSMLEAFSDASWINHVEDSSSTSGWVFLLWGGAILWASNKQTCITGFTKKYEFIALAVAGKEAEWLKNLIHEILIWPKLIAPLSIHCDSPATLAKAYSQIYNGKSRHLGTDNQEKNEKQSQNNKTGLGMEKTVKDKAKSKPESQSSQKVNRKVNWSKSKSTQVNPGAKGTCLYDFARKDFVDFRSIDWANVMEKHDAVDLSCLLWSRTDIQEKDKKKAKSKQFHARSRKGQSQKSYEHDNGFVFADISIGADIQMYAGIASWAENLLRVGHQFMQLDATSNTHCSGASIFISASSVSSSCPTSKEVRIAPWSSSLFSSSGLIFS